MPADFTDKTAQLNAINDLFGHATGFGTRVKTFLNGCLGASNPFGTAATRDVGTAAGNVAAMESTSGELLESVLPRASMTQDGAVQIETNPNATGDAAITASAAASFLAPFLDAIPAMRVNSDVIQHQPYGPDNNRRSAFVIPQEASIILISANGGVEHHEASTGAASVDGDSISLLDNSDNVIVTINGGDAPRANRAGAAVQPATDYSDAPEDSITVISASTAASLGLRTGVVLKGAGARGQPLGEMTVSSRRGAWRVLWQDGGAADLFIGVKEATDSALVWRTDNPPSPYFVTPSLSQLRARPSVYGITYGYARSIRIG